MANVERTDRPPPPSRAGAAGYRRSEVVTNPLRLITSRRNAGEVLVGLPL